MTKPRTCKDCKKAGRPLTRPAPHPGPRCATHHLKVKNDRKEAAHDKRTQRVYGLAPGEYQLLYVAQGGRCAILRCRATGTGRRKLAVDHDHKTGKVRGLICSTHNQMFADNGDDPEVFQSMANYLESPPAYEILGASPVSCPPDQFMGLAPVCEIPDCGCNGNAHP